MTPAELSACESEWKALLERVSVSGDQDEIFMEGYTAGLEQGKASRSRDYDDATLLGTPTQNKPL